MVQGEIASFNAFCNSNCEDCAVSKMQNATAQVVCSLVLFLVALEHQNDALGVELPCLPTRRKMITQNLTFARFFLPVRSLA
jgi:hypothetical protein